MARGGAAWQPAWDAARIGSARCAGAQQPRAQSTQQLLQRREASASIGAACSAWRQKAHQHSSMQRRIIET